MFAFLAPLLIHFYEPYHFHLPPSTRLRRADAATPLRSLGLVPAASMLFTWDSGLPVHDCLHQQLYDMKQAATASQVPTANNAAQLDAIKVDTSSMLGIAGMFVNGVCSRAASSCTCACERMCLWMLMSLFMFVSAS